MGKKQQNEGELTRHSMLYSILGMFFLVFPGFKPHYDFNVTIYKSLEDPGSDT